MLKFANQIALYFAKVSKKIGSLSTGDKIGLSSLILAIITALVPTLIESKKEEGIDTIPRNISTEAGVISPYNELSSIKKINSEVEYLTVKSKTVIGMFHNNIKGKVDGQIYSLLTVNDDTESDDGICAEVTDSRDFDGNGSTDALVTHIIGCGGNCCANSFFFYSYDGDGHFSQTEEFGESWIEPKIEKWKGHWSVLVINVDERMGKHQFYQVVERYVLESGKAVLVEKTEKKAIEAIIEIKADDLDDSETNSEKHIYYDLDNDGKKDTLSVSYWERWHRIMFSVSFANGKSFGSSTGLSRIGILMSKTNGVHDLVGDFDLIIKWKGDRYDIDDESDETMEKD